MLMLPIRLPRCLTLLAPSIPRSPRTYFCTLLLLLAPRCRRQSYRVGVLSRLASFNSLLSVVLPICMPFRLWVWLTWSEQRQCPACRRFYSLSICGSDSHQEWTFLPSFACLPPVERP